MLGFVIGFLTACMLIGYVGYYVTLPEELRHKREMAVAVKQAYDSGYQDGRSMPRYDIRD